MLRLLVRRGPALVVLVVLAVYVFDIGGARRPIFNAYLNLVGRAVRPVTDSITKSANEQIKCAVARMTVWQAQLQLDLAKPTPRPSGKPYVTSPLTANQAKAVRQKLAAAVVASPTCFTKEQLAAAGKVRAAK